MLTLRDVPLFSQLSDVDFRVVEACAEEAEFPAGAALCRRGDTGRLVYVPVSGAVKLETGAGPGAVLGPGHVIGELSILSGNPVSATVTALQPVKAFTFDKQAFLRLLESSQVLHRALSELLVERVLREPDAHGRGFRQCVAMLVPDERALRVARGVLRRIRGYTERAVYCEFGKVSGADPARSKARDGLPFECPGSAWRPLDEEDGFLLDLDHCSPADTLGQWRRLNQVAGPLVLVLPLSGMAVLKPILASQDALIVIGADGREEAPDCGSGHTTWGAADLLQVYLGRESDGQGSLEGGCWGLRLDDTGFPDAMSADASRDLDLVARWALRRSVGLALGAGAARGLAHLGVLQVLEQEGVPVDSLAGTSIGGIVSLAYGLTGSAEGAVAIMREYMSRKDLVLDRFKTYFSAYYSGRKIRRSASAVFGDRRIEHLRRPVSVVAADLFSGEKIVIDRGEAANALLATSAIPGIFPPVERDGRLLFDGASVSRVPVDLLEGRRCALRIAVNVSPQPCLDPSSVEATRRSISRFMGFRNVWMRNWEVQAYWDGVKETASADILIEPDTADFSMFDFDRFDELVDLGRKAAEDRLSDIRSALALSGGSARP
jgi:NTE family protein